MLCRSVLLLTSMRSVGVRGAAAALPSLASSVALRRAANSATVASVTAPRMSWAALAVAARTQYASSGKRDHEAFLTQFDPMDVLEVEADCTIEEIDEAFERLKARYGPNGPVPNAKMVDRVFQAHEILKDPDSPYYTKAHASQADRQRLQFQLLPRYQRRLVQAQVVVLCAFAGLILFLTLKVVFAPIKKPLRAATRT